MACIDVEPGVKVFAQIEGEGKPIVLIHGWYLNHDMWKFQIPYLTAHGYQAIAIDLRGFGQSSKPKTGYDYKTWANDIEKVIAALDLQHVTLAGYSIGGAISMYYLSTRTDPRIEKLALVAAAGPCATIRWDNPHGLPREFFDETILLLSLGQYAYAFQQFYQIAFPTASPPMLQWIGNMFKSASKQALIGGLKEMRDQNLKKDLVKIGVKTRIFHGFWDLFVPRALAKEQASLIKGAIRRWFWRSGHGLFFEEADKLSRELDW
ncbi:MAG: alpha/beta hydrolase [Euryarchaeota archaeon]